METKQKDPRPPASTGRANTAPPPRRRPPAEPGRTRQADEAAPKRPAPAQGGSRPAPARASARPEASGKAAARPASGRASNRPAAGAKKTGRPEGKNPNRFGNLFAKKPRPDNAIENDLSTGKKRAYGNSKQKKPSTLQQMGKAVSATVQKQKKRKQAKEQAAGKRGRAKPNAPTIIYTEPKKFNTSQLAMQLLTMAAVVAALVLGVSVFFKVGVITVTGCGVYDAWTIQEASGIQEGDSLLSFSRPRAGAQIKANLPYVKTVRFGIKLPDTVNIIIEEEDVVYAVKDTTGTWWLISSKGRVVEQAKGNKAKTYTQILGITLENPSPNTQAVVHEDIPEADAEGQMAVLTTTNTQRLSAALEIVSALEQNDIVGAAASVDVTRLEDIILWYGTRYQVNLGDNTSLTYKIACMNDVIMQLSEYQSGILDISFTIWPTQVGYTPFG